MKKILAVFLITILILQTGITTVLAESSESNRRVIVIGHVDSLPLDDGTVPCATIIKTYGFSAANIELINEKWIIPRQFTISGNDIAVQDGKYSYYMKIRSDGTLVFDNDLEIYYQGVDGLYKLNYEIDKNDNHVMLVDLRPKGITGKRAEKRLERVFITCNKNAIPFDPEKPTVTSGIRLGTPAVTTRGMKEADMNIIAEVIDNVLSANADDKETFAKILEDNREIIKGLLERYPLYR